MSLRKFDELTKEQQEKVMVMYSDKDTLFQYLYNFDVHGIYHGRQFAPSSGVTKEGIPFGTIHAESTVPDEPKEDVKEELPEKLVDTQPVKKVRKSSKKK